MADNNDAQEAIKDIKEAIEEVGSDISIITFVAGETDSYGVVIIPESTNSEDTKGIISNDASEEVNRAFLSRNSESLSSATYEMSIMLYTENGITEDQKIIKDSIEYEIVHVSTTEIQNTIIRYEILVKGQK